MQSGTNVTVVVPTYNERENLPKLIEAIEALGYRVLVVDDGSPDGTGEVADRLAASYETVDVLHRTEKQGLGPAYAAGFDLALAAGADIVCEMDADFSHDPDDLPRLVEEIASDRADVVIGSRYVPGGATPDWSLHRRLLSRAGNRYARLMLALPVNDATAGFRAFRAGALADLAPATCEASGYGFQVEMIGRAVGRGLRVVEIPVVFRDRTHGESKMRGRIVFEAMWLVTRWGLGRFAGRGRQET